MDKGDDILDGLKRICQEMKLNSATFQGIGACDNVRVATFIPEKQ